ncbi:hypothetical protein TNCV_844051 [Trichonephila clavipes]|nr:hypothetical protein TNCV_844051 [Trichonephila clavipes]
MKGLVDLPQLRDLNPTHGTWKHDTLPYGYPSGSYFNFRYNHVRFDARDHVFLMHEANLNQNHPYRQHSLSLTFASVVHTGSSWIKH